MKKLIDRVLSAHTQLWRKTETWEEVP